MSVNLIDSSNIEVKQSGSDISLDLGSEVVVDSIRTKNIFGNYAIINGWISETTMRVNSINGNRMAFINCKPNTTYTISRSVITSTFRVGEYTSIPTMTSSNVDYTIPTAIENNGGTTITYTTSSTAKYLIVHYGKVEESNTSSSLATIQVEEGSTATTYTPYQNLGEELAYNKSTYTSNGISIRFEKVGRIVFCTFEGSTTSALTANTDYTVSMSSIYAPKEVVRNCVIFNEPGVIGYVYINPGATLLYRVKTNVSTNQYPRFSFSYISAN